jgi:hypothetical protein
MASSTETEAKVLKVLEYKAVFGVKLQVPCDMADDQLRSIIELAQKHLGGLKNWQEEGNAAVSSMKEALDTQYGPHWTVIAGKHWGASITHDARHFINFILGKDLDVTVSVGSAGEARMALLPCFSSPRCQR